MARYFIDRPIFAWVIAIVIMLAGALAVVELRRLVTGQMIGERIVIESGLQAGDRVIVAGLQKVRPGVPVKVAQAKPAGAGQAATPNKAE